MVFAGSILASTLPDNRKNADFYGENQLFSSKIGNNWEIQPRTLDRKTEIQTDEGGVSFVVHRAMLQGAAVENQSVPIANFDGAEIPQAIFAFHPPLTTPLTKCLQAI